MNVLTYSLKIFHITKSNFFELNSFTVINKYDKRAAVQISNVFETVEHVAWKRVLKGGTFFIFI